LPIFRNDAGRWFHVTRTRQRDIHAIGNRRKYGDNEERFKGLHRRSPGDPVVDRGGVVDRDGLNAADLCDRMTASCDCRDPLYRMANCGKIIGQVVF
jgi:hypothetical protein